jgi:hypothetical protein
LEGAALIQFTAKQVETYRSRLRHDDAIVVELQQRVRELFEFKVPVPQTGVATWAHYYFCPEHSVQLKFDPCQPHRHVCPVDGAVFSGKPYDGAWWRLINELNARGVYECGLLWLLTRDIKYLAKAKAILSQYARYYPDYQVHGNIPYNGPGKANAQTLCEALWLQPLACGYDLLRAGLTPAEKERIEAGLFIPGAEFIRNHLTPQLHNHEVIINGALGILGVLLGREDLIDIAVNAQYGLHYQLENAVLEDGFWFEGSLHYHIFALEAFLGYEKFAYHTPYRLNHPKIPKMLEFPLRLVQPDGKPPLLNDAIDIDDGTKDQRFAAVYEFGLREYANPEVARFLQWLYQDGSRRNCLEAFLYGVDSLAEPTPLRPTAYHNADGSGLTVLHGPEGRYLLVKHSPFGGEHDHYDRLGLSYHAYGEAVAPDLGTTGYGAKLHYEYYKNTGSHNTVVINEENQPPANPKVRRFWEGPQYILLDTEVCWDGGYQGLDSFTLVQWDEPSYAGARLRRIILWCASYFIELFLVDGLKAPATIDWVLHVPGRLQPNQAVAYPGVFSSKKPFKYLKNMRSLPPSGVVRSNWELQNCRFNLYSFCNIADNRLYYGDGPDNPSVKDISYLINRVNGKEALFANLFETVGPDEHGVAAVDFQIGRDEVTIIVTVKGQCIPYRVSLQR